MSKPLDFEIVTNDDTLVELLIRKRSDQSAHNLTGAEITWRLFGPDGSVLIEKAPDDITILDQTASTGKIQFMIEQADSAALNTAYYPHEAVVVQTSQNNTVTNGDDLLTAGRAYIRRQLKAP